MQHSQLARVFDQADEPLSIRSVSKELGVDWHTAKKRMEKEREAGNLYRAKMSDRLFLYWTSPLPFGGDDKNVR